MLRVGLRWSQLVSLLQSAQQSPVAVAVHVFPPIQVRLIIRRKSQSAQLRPLSDIGMIV